MTQPEYKDTSSRGRLVHNEDGSRGDAAERGAAADGQPFRQPRQ